MLSLGSAFSSFVFLLSSFSVPFSPLLTDDGFFEPAGSGCERPVFSGSVLSDTAVGSSDSVVADFNGDGRPDLAILNGSQALLTVQFGAGQGRFGPPRTIDPAASGFSLLAADLNNDGIQDLVTPPRIYLGAGDGTFPTRRPTGFGPSTARHLAADLNGDGHIDIVSSRFLTGTLEYLFGDGTGGFAPPIELTVPGGTVTNFDLSDFNSDGFADIVAIYNGANGFAVSLGGPAGPQAPVSYPVTGPGITNSLAVGDTDADGDADVLAIGSQFGTTAPFRVSLINNGNGTFSASAPVADSGPDATRLYLFDINRDGRPDYLRSHPSGFAVIRLSTPGGGFDDESWLYGIANQSEVFFEDFTGDGFADLGFSSGGLTSFSVVPGTGDRSAGQTPLAVDDFVLLDSESGDLNEDGRRDIVIASDSNKLFVIFGNGSAFVNPVSVSLTATPHHVLVADFNNDGNEDLLAITQASGITSSEMFYGNGNGTFQPRIVGGIIDYRLAGKPALLNLDNDGYIDLLLPTTNQNRVGLYQNTGAGTFTVFGVRLDVGANVNSVAAEDFDLDGRTDVAILAGSVHVFLGNGTFQPDPLGVFPAGSANGHLFAADLNGDQWPDLAVSSRQTGASGTPGRVAVMLGAGKGGFGAPTIYPAGRGAFTMVANDFDGDGNRDLAVANQGYSYGGDSRVTVFFGDGTGSFPRRMQTGAGMSPRSLLSWDYDSDARPDLIVTDYFFGVVQLLKNQCQPAPAAIASVLGTGADAAVTEPDAGELTVNVPVTLSQASAVPVTVRYRTSPFLGLPGTAVPDDLTSAGAGQDYVPAWGVLTFQPGETAKTVQIRVRGDVLDEYDERFTLTLTNSTNAGLADRVTVITIVDNDQPPSVSIGGVANPEGNSGNTVFQVPVTLSAPSGKTVSFGFQTGGGTATANQDYQRATGVSSISPGAVTTSIPVSVAGDLTIEPDETFLIDLLDPVNAVPVVSRATATIANDDLGGTVRFSAASYTVSENAGSVQVTVDRTGGSGGGASFRIRTQGVTATPGQDYVETAATVVLADNETSRVFTVPIYSDQLNEPDETFTVQIDEPNLVTVGAPSSAPVTIQNVDAQPNLNILDASVLEGDNGTAQLRFSVRLSRPTQRPVSVDFATADETATAGSDYQSTAGTLTFAPGVVRRTLFVTVSGDFLFEPDETLFLNLTNVQNAALTDGQAVGRIINDEPGTGARTELISINRQGTASGNLDSTSPTITGNGRYVAFDSFASDLVPGDTNGLRDVFVRDLITGQTTLVSRNQAGNNGGNCASRAPIFAENGRFVYFLSCASDLDGPGAGAAIYRRDIETNQTVLASADFSGAPVSADPVAVSPDGRHIAFQTIAPNMSNIPDTQFRMDVFVRDMNTGTNRMVSVNSAGNGPGNADSGNPSTIDKFAKMTPDGRFVLFPSVATNLVPQTGGPLFNYYVRDLQAQTTVAVSLNSAGTQLVGASGRACLSDDGVYAVFASVSANIVANDNNNQIDVFRREVATGSTVLVSTANGGTQSANGISQRPVCSPTARYIAFDSDAGNITPMPDTLGYPDVIWRDMQTGEARLVSVNRDGGVADDFSLVTALTPDGGKVLFTSFARNLVGPSIDTNQAYDIFVRNLASASTTVVSVNENGTSTGNSNSTGGVMSSDGSVVAFATDASNLVSIDNNGTAVDIFYYTPVVRSVPQSDFDGDGKTDLTVFRPSSSTWFSLFSSNGSFNSNQFGLPTDEPVSGDFDGDRRTDLAVFRSGVWYFLYSSNGAFGSINFGEAGDRLVAGDFDGDRKSDLAVYRNGLWQIRESSDGNVRTQSFGLPNDIPVAADFDGDRRSDIAVYRDGLWYILQSVGFSLRVQQFGIAGDRPVPGDYDGDGRADIVVFRPSTGGWFQLLSGNGSVVTTQFGISTDLPVRGDFDGDGKSDVAVFRQGVWFVNRSSDQSYFVTSFGLPGDIPVPR